jgi:putative phosphonate metabolism protein
MSGNDAARYAIYYAPEPSSKLWLFGSSVIGYDAVDGTDHSVPVFTGGLADRWHELTTEPRKYGFHATLKAPFHLAQGVDETALMVAIERFCQTARVAIIEGLEVASIGPFIALRPYGDVAALNALASTIVRHFEPFRAPLSTEDRARRLKSPLTERQTDYLDRFGYPYVHEEFRFHMTLTGPLHADDRETTLSLLKSAFQQYGGATQTAVDRICLFKQDTPTSRFRIIGSAILA